MVDHALVVATERCAFAFKVEGKASPAALQQQCGLCRVDMIINEVDLCSDQGESDEEYTIDAKLFTQGQK